MKLPYFSLNLKLLFTDLFRFRIGSGSGQQFRIRIRITDCDTFQGNEGNDMLLPCTPPDSDPPAIIQWYKDGHLLNISDPSQVISGSMN